MSDVGSVSGSRQRAFDNEEIEAMKRNDSTSAIVNKGRRDAGFKESDVTLRGDDRTLGKVLHDGQSHIDWAEAVAGTIHAAEVAEVVGVGEHAMAALGWAPHVALPVGALIAAHVGMCEMERKKAEMKDGATRDQLHAALVTTLDVPAGFKDAELSRLEVSVTNQSTAKKTSDQFAEGMRDSKLRAALQLHCDQGMNAARTMTDAGQSKDAFLKAQSEVAKRYADDAAFRNGFDALVWAKNADETTYRETTTALDSRDARYDAANIAVRIRM